MKCPRPKGSYDANKRLEAMGGSGMERRSRSKERREDATGSQAKARSRTPAMPNKILQAMVDKRASCNPSEEELNQRRGNTKKKRSR